VLERRLEAAITQVADKTELVSTQYYGGAHTAEKKYPHAGVY
jgi:hypothetical protein